MTQTFNLTRIVLITLALIIVLVASTGANLLPNGGFEKDSDGDGIADGWIVQPANFSREKLTDLQAFIDKLPSQAELLEGQKILASDGSLLWGREPDGKWGPEALGTGGNWGEYEKSWKTEVNWRERMQREYLPQASRFGEFPVPAGLDLGDTTLMLSNAEPRKQVISQPIEVKPGTGYKLVFWFRTSGGTDYWWGPQILDGACNPDTVPSSPQPSEHYNNPNVVNSIPSAYWWGAGVGGRYWARMEIPFRTSPECKSIVIRLPYEFREDAERKRMRNESYRIWYDDFSLVEDPSILRSGPTDEALSDKPEPTWSPEAVTRGFATVPRPTLPLTYDSYIPEASEIDAPIRLALSAGETDSAVVFVRGLAKEEIVLRAEPGQLASKNGYGLQNAYGARFITVRAAEMAPRFLTAKRYVYTPKLLLNSSDLTVRPGGSGQFWMTVTVPPGTPPGEYTGNLTLTRTRPATGEPAARKIDVPIVLTVRDIALEEADAAFFVWGDTSPVQGTRGPATALSGADSIYYADMARHGMNTVCTYCFAERKDKDGKVHVSYNELDALIESIRGAGLCKTQPFFLGTWRDGGVGGEFGELAGGKDTIMAITNHGKKSGWPNLIWAVLDEPDIDSRCARVQEVIKTQYAEPRKKGVKTAVAGGYAGTFLRPLSEKGDTLGDLYDVWIESMYTENWPELQAAAKKKKAQLWMYNCWLTGAGYLQERFYSGLWTWRTGAKGNGSWAYGWYVRINESGMPESLMAWEGRAAGVNDYRYLQTLESAVAKATGRGKTGPAIQAAKKYLDDLRQSIPLTAYRSRPGAIPQVQWAEMDAYNPVPAIRPEDYPAIREACATHIAAIRKEAGNRK